jgi:hypothetical protein
LGRVAVAVLVAAFAEVPFRTGGFGSTGVIVISIGGPGNFLATLFFLISRIYNHNKTKIEHNFFQHRQFLKYNNRRVKNK